MCWEKRSANFCTLHFIDSISPHSLLAPLAGNVSQISHLISLSTTEKFTLEMSRNLIRWERGGGREGEGNSMKEVSIKRDRKVETLNQQITQLLLLVSGVEIFFNFEEFSFEFLLHKFGSLENFSLTITKFYYLFLLQICFWKFSYFSAVNETKIIRAFPSVWVVRKRNLQKKPLNKKKTTFNLRRRYMMNFWFSGKRKFLVSLMLVFISCERRKKVIFLNCRTKLFYNHF